MRQQEMKYRILAALAAMTLATGAHAGTGSGVVLHDAANPRTVVVELFTSEGCSSCPPADALLQKLVRERSTDGTRIIALGENVDYWNRVGWRDPFSDAQFSNRQSDYARTFRNDQVYTPQMVVKGQAEFVGSDEERARQEIGRAAQGRQAFVPLNLMVSMPAPGQLQIGVDAAAAKGVSGNYAIYYAVTEDGLDSKVARGENAGRHLTHAAVVRHLDRLMTYSPSVGISGVTKTLRLSGSEPLRGLHVVAFVQSVETGAIVSGAEVDLKNLSEAATTRK